MTPAALARQSEQRRSDAVWTQTLAAQLALQFQRARLTKQRPAQPTKGDSK